MRPIIKAENLAKQYRIGARQETHATLRETVASAARAPLRLFSRRNGGDDQTLWALRDVSFEVERGEAVGIIGRNGAGKSTLLKVLSRITEPTRGRATIWGRVASLLEVGTGFHPELTGRENIYLNGAILGMSRHEIRRRFDEIVSFAEVERFIDTPVKRYSSGMHMRLAFAVAAHLEPEILIVDEVLAVGDAAFQKKCVGKMGGAARQGRTILFVSHNMEAVRKLCGRGVFLEQGRVSFLGSAEEAIRKYIEGGAEAQAVYDVPPPNAEDGAPGRATRMVIEDADGRPAQAIMAGRPWQIRVHFTIDRRTEHFILGLGFRTVTDVALRTSWSAPADIEPGEYEAVFREERLWLTPGRYPIVVGLSTNKRTFQYADVGALEIAEVSEGLDLVSITGAGLVLNPLDVRIEKVG